MVHSPSPRCCAVEEAAQTGLVLRRLPQRSQQIGLSSALARLRDDCRFHEIPDDRSLFVSTGRYFADGQAVEVAVRPTADGEGLLVGTRVWS